MSTLPSLHRLVMMSYTWFADLPVTVQADVLSRTKKLELVSGTQLFARGDAADSAYCVVKGSIRAGRLEPDGSETVLDYYGPGVWFGEMAVLDGLPRQHTVVAHGPTTVRQLPKRDLEELAAHHPTFGRALLGLEALRLRMLICALEAYSTQSLEQRLASRLLMLAGNYSAARGRRVSLKLHLSQEALAQLIGATRQSVNQILRSWKAADLVHQRYGRTTLKNPEKLEKIADGMR